MKPSLLLALILICPRTSRAASENLLSGAAGSFRQMLQTPLKALIPGLGVRTLSDEDILIDILEDRGRAPEDRAQAARALRNYALSSYRAENALLAAIDRRDEKDEKGLVAREAVKSLAWAAQHHGTRAKLLSLASDSRAAEGLRAIALKSLYVVSHEHEVRSALQRVFEDREPLAVREAAAWSMGFQSLNDYSIRRSLLSAAGNSREPLSIRVEAVKSLYGAMSQWDVRNAVESLAKDSALKEPLREAAILALHSVNQDWAVKRYLEDVARGGESSALRQAAIKALYNGQTLELVHYFHLSHYLGKFIDPLENQ